MALVIDDAEKAFYEEVLGNPEGPWTIQDLRLAYYLAVLDGGIEYPASTLALIEDEGSDVRVALDALYALPEIPDEGTFVLTATDGVLSWEAVE